jgi:molybdopterin/thiamine biosynthesis adenylyltransferase
MPPIDVRLAHVHIGGVGRVGTAVALALQSSGVGRISCNDPQLFEEEQFACCAFSLRSDLGRPKVKVLERLFDGRPGFVFEPLVEPNESSRVNPYLEKADLIVSCANRLSARLHLERAAVALEKPSVQASVHDGRLALGGVITSWIPGSAGCCFGCLFPQPNVRFARGEVLPPALTSTVGSIAAQTVLDLLADRGPANVRRPNLTIVDLVGYAIERLSVRRRKGCRVCGRQERAGRAQSPTGCAPEDRSGIPSVGRRRTHGETHADV